MVKKKSFWLILLTVLTAVVLAFCACGLVGCSSESDDDDTKTEGNEGGGTEGGGTEGGGTSGGTEGGGTEGGGTEGGGTSGGSGDTGDTGDTGSSDVLFVLQGYYDALGTDYWGVVTFNEDGSGYFETYYQNGDPFTMFTGDIGWEYTDDDNMEIEATMSIMGQQAYFPVVLAAVNGQVVAGTMYIEEVNSEAILYIDTAVGALVSKDLMGDTHANVVLYDDYTCAVEIEGEAETGEWEYTDEGAGVSLTVGQTPYTATIEVNDKGQITEAVFSSFEGVTSAVFLPIGTVDYTLYSFVSNEGYTLIMNDDGTFETTVDDTTYTGMGSTSTLALADDDNDTTYTPTITYGTDDDGNQYIESVTYAEYFGGKTNVTFILPADVVNREDSETYQSYYNSSDHGTAVAVLIGHGVTLSGEDYVTDETDDNEYWMFLYPDGAVKAHVYDGVSQYTVGDATWTWAVNEDEELVPTLNRSTTVDGQATIIPYQAVANDNGTWTVHMQSSMRKDTNWYEYTFANDDYPAGAFGGTMDDGADETTYYLVLYMDGTFKAHLGSSRTSDGCWAKDENGTFTIGKKSADYTGYPNITYTFVECTQTVNDDGTVTVPITNYGDANTFYYIIDTSIIPVGGYDMSEFET